MKKLATSVLLALLLAGCAQQWIKVDPGAEALKTDRYSVQLPTEWVRIQQGDVLTVTRDGPDLQKIRIQASKHEQAFGGIEKSTNKDMLPHELSELFIAEIKKESGDGLPSFEVISNEPIQHAGQDAFRLYANYLTEGGLQYRMVAVGFVTEKHFYAVSYTAPSLVFFEQSEGMFDQTLTSLYPI